MSQFCAKNVSLFLFQCHTSYFFYILKKFSIYWFATRYKQIPLVCILMFTLWNRHCI